MIDWITEFLGGLSWSTVLWSVLLFVVTFTLSLAFTGFLLVRLPETFFLESHVRERHDRHPAVYWTLRVLKNLAGIGLVVLGVALSLPGVPGQGLLTVLIGVVLLDFPGKRRLERKLIGWPRVYRAVNRLRARYRRPPLLLEEPGEAKTSTTAAEND